MRRSALVAFLAVIAVVAAPAALANWSSGVTPTSPGGLVLGTATLADPTSLAAANGACTNNNAASLRVDLTWVATASARATGYVVLRNGTQVGTVGGAGSTSWSDATGQLAFGTAYTYTVKSTVQSWTSPGATASVTSLSKTCH
jgi:hypothetical protein